MLKVVPRGKLPPQTYCTKNSQYVVCMVFLTKKQKTKNKMPNGWRTMKSLVHKIRLHGGRGKGMAESFSREKLRHAPQKEGG